MGYVPLIAHQKLPKSSFNRLYTGVLKKLTWASRKRKSKCELKAPYLFWELLWTNSRCIVPSEATTSVQIILLKIITIKFIKSHYNQLFHAFNTTSFQSYPYFLHKERGLAWKIQYKKILFVVLSTFFLELRTQKKNTELWLFGLETVITPVQPSVDTSSAGVKVEYCFQRMWCLLAASCVWIHRTRWGKSLKKISSNLWPG
jgi:hypothetical protein